MKAYAIVLVSLLAASSMAADLAGSYKEAAVAADTQPKDREARIYESIDLNDYYQQKYGPVFESCLRSTHDMSPFSFVLAIGADGRVLRIYADHETNVFACVRPALQKGEFPHPPFAPYYEEFSMKFSQ